jgi:hypothetical protein
MRKIVNLETILFFSSTSVLINPHPPPPPPPPEHVFKALLVDKYVSLFNIIE